MKMKPLAAIPPEICRRIHVLVLDVDGVLTDGAVIYSSGGDEIKAFHARDGAALKYWHEAGHISVWISGRDSAALRRRAAELGVHRVLAGVAEKLPALKKLCGEIKVQLAECAYIGDDLPDLAAMAAVGLAIAVADAADEVRDSAAAVTVFTGGRGAVREAVEALLKAQGMWSSVVAKYAAGETDDGSAT